MEKDVKRPLKSEWLSAKAWTELCRAPHVSPSFALLPDKVSAAPNDWRPIFDALEPQTAVLPGGYDTLLSPFEKVGSTTRKCNPQRCIVGAGARTGPAFPHPLSV